MSGPGETQAQAIARLTEELTSNAAMLARQCDLARDAETLATHQAQEIARLREALKALGPKAGAKAAFMAGWAEGYSDGGESDCRMFEPSAERAWKQHADALARLREGA